jgi:hypothetical protein
MPLLPTDPYLKNSTHTVLQYTNALGFTDQQMYNQKGGLDRNTARLTLGVGLAVSAFPLSVPV